MLDNTIIHRKKSIAEQLSEVCTIVFDVLSCIFLAIPLLLQAAFKIFFFSRKDISGKLVLVTGGGNGLGKSICLCLAKNGCNLAVVDIDLQAAQETVKVIKKIDQNIKAIAYRVDVSKSDEILKLRGDVRNDLGPVDILINNAGLMSNKNMDEDVEYLEMMVKVNVLGTIMMTKFFLEQMKECQSGHIVSISSMSALNATPFSIPYTATKFGINGFMSALTEHLRLDKWRSKIKTTCVFPYYVKTRQDVIEFLHPDIRIPPLECEVAATEVVEGIKREDINVTIPTNQKFLVKLLGILPLSVQELARDRVMREYSWRNPNCKLNFGSK